MPIYEFECQSCGEIISLLLKIGEEITVCPLCRERVKRIMSLCSFNNKKKYKEEEQQYDTRKRDSLMREEPVAEDNVY